jgi:oligosaccharide repeat unit polymerase
LIFLVGVALLTGRIKPGKAFLYSALLAFGFFVMIAVLLGKGGDVNASAADNVAGIGKAFDVYLLAPLPSLDTFVRHQESMRLGDNVLRSFWVAMDKLGFETHPVPLVNEFVNVPYPSNVYTIYRPYFDDFGLLGAVGIQFFLGLLHGVLYRKRFASRFFLCVFAISLYPLAMQFFEDQYLSLLSLWVQTAAVLFVFTRAASVLHRKLPGLTAEPVVELP